MVCAIVMNSGTSGRFYWNLSHDVGPGCTNAADDVELVRFAYHCMGINPSNRVSKPANKAIFAALPLQGGFDAQLKEVIRLHQAERGGTQDGKVSKLKDATGNYGTHVMMLVALNNNMMDIMGETWPRIDKHHQTSGMLTAQIKGVFTLPPVA